MDKVVFLDIDGVLNSNFWLENNERELSNGTLIDSEKVKLLSDLIKKTNAKIILHSGWRFWFDGDLKPLRLEAEKFLEMLNAEGLWIDGVTPDLTTEEIRETKKFSLVKAAEILLWLSEHKEVKSWVVLEDLYLHNEEVDKHQVKTDATVGLTEDDVKRAVEILMN